MITKEDSYTWYIECDYCEETFYVDLDDYHEMIDELKSKGWKTNDIGEQICPKCYRKVKCKK